jgi:hypothetical protein
VTSKAVAKKKAVVEATMDPVATERKLSVEWVDDAGGHDACLIAKIKRMKMANVLCYGDVWTYQLKIGDTSARESFSSLADAKAGVERALGIE